MKTKTRKRKAEGFSFDFSSLTFRGPVQETVEVPHISTAPVAFENAERMAAAIDYDRDYFALVSGSFIFGDFIEALLFKKRLAPAAVYLTTLGMSRENADSIVNLVDYLGCDKVNLLVSHYFAGTERRGIVPYMEREFAGRPIDVAVLSSHCKIALILSEAGDVLISGSANLSSSNNVEQFIMMHDPGVIAYVRERLDNIMQRFTVYRGESRERLPQNNRDNRGKDAFDAMTKGAD